MTTIVLDSHTSELSIEHLLRQAAGGGVQVQDASGNLVACVVTPANRSLLTYIEAILDLIQNREKTREALARKGGITTAELLRCAQEAAERAGK